MTAHPNRSRRTQSPARNPAPDEIRAARKAAGLTQTEAARLIHSTLRTWQDWESGIARMHPGLWELFKIKDRLRAQVETRMADVRANKEASAFYRGAAYGAIWAAYSVDALTEKERDMYLEALKC